jgi:hypothetical protein
VGHPSLSRSSNETGSTSAIFHRGNAKACWDYQIYNDPDENGGHEPYKGIIKPNGSLDVKEFTSKQLVALEKLVDISCDLLLKKLSLNKRE